MPISSQLKAQVNDLIEQTELMLATPALRSRITLAAEAQGCLIRQLFWAEQLLAAITEGVDYADQLHRLDRANHASCRAVEALHDFHCGT